MKTKFTKGPWQLKQNENCKHKDLQVWTKHGYMVGATVIKVDETRLDGESWLDMRDRTENARELAKEEANANVALIACAPDMYEMLVDILECAEDSHTEIHHSDLIHSLHDGINRLLKRARGE
jgi:hypothetical protein